ncbi:poly polymerase [Trichonephila clavipes]|nr:poly polymerase [Trichonephila clavipes]
MIPAYNKKRCAAVPFETGIHFRRKTDFFPEEDTTKSYSGLESEPIRLQAEGHSHHTGLGDSKIVIRISSPRHDQLQSSSLQHLHTSAFGVAIAGSSSGTRFLEVPSGDSPFLPEHLQL